MQLNWDEPDFAASEVARILDVPEKLIANWTDRGLVDPYHGNWEWKRGRGRARQYSLRNILTIVAMKDLSDRYEIPVPLGRRICAAAFGDVNPFRAGYVVVEGVRAERVRTVFCRTANHLVRHLDARPMKSALILNMAALFAAVKGRAKTALTERNSARSAESLSARDTRSPEAIRDQSHS